MTQLYIIADNINKLLNDDDITAEALADTLESLEFDFEEKAKNIIGLVKNKRSEVTMFENEIKSLKSRMNSANNMIDRLSSYLHLEMGKIERNKLDLGVHIALVRKGVKVVDITDINELPDDYIDINTIIKPNKKLILAALKNDEEISGAKIKTNPDTLTIK